MKMEFVKYNIFKVTNVRINVEVRVTARLIITMDFTQFQRVTAKRATTVTAVAFLIALLIAITMVYALTIIIARVTRDSRVNFVMWIVDVMVMECALQITHASVIMVIL